jgi:hypothetical protein
MKSLITTILIFSSLLIFGQTPLTFEDVVSLEESIKKESLYNRGNHWVIEVFKNPQKVIQLTDKEGGQMICKGNFGYKASNPLWMGAYNTEGVINFTIKLFFKEGRYKYVITDFVHEPLRSGFQGFGLITTDDECPITEKLGTSKWRKKVWDDIKMKIDEEVPGIIDSLKDAMKEKTEQEDDW